MMLTDDAVEQALAFDYKRETQRWMDLLHAEDRARIAALIPLETIKEPCPRWHPGDVLIHVQGLDREHVENAVIGTFGLAVVLGLAVFGPRGGY